MVERYEAEEFVHGIYRGVLRREPDPAGLDHYVGCVLGGRSHASILREFLACEEFKASVRTKLFVPPGHFYSPVADQDEARRHHDLLEKTRVPEALADIALERKELVGVWHSLLPFLQTSPFEQSRNPRFRYAFDNPAYSWADGSILHAMLRHYRPSRIIEIGSGWSSACILDTVDYYLPDVCEVTFIEPHAKLLRTLIGTTKGNVRLIEQQVQSVSRELFVGLKENDILLIDSTHVLRTGSDVCFELFEILPLLARGVVVHVHDMFWPFEYPRSWAVEENRSWNELYAVRALLTNNDHWNILMFNDWFVRFEYKLIADTYPPFLRNPGSALWLRRS